jgi:hypothetical protein
MSALLKNPCGILWQKEKKNNEQVLSCSKFANLVLQNMLYEPSLNLQGCLRDLYVKWHMT